MKLGALSLTAVLSTATALRGSKSNAKTNNGFGLWSRTLQRGENTRGIEYPDFRFVPWCILDPEIKEQAEAMRFDNITWNDVGSNDIEDYSFDFIADKSDKVATFLTDIGWEKETFDCYINHYADYTWSELEEAGVSEYAQVLGWNSSSWDKEIDYSPDSDDKDWDELTLEEQNAAAEICYFEELWDGLPIPEWGDFGSSFSCPDEEEPVEASESNATATTTSSTNTGAWEDVSGSVVTDIVDTYENSLVDPDPADVAVEAAEENTLEPGAVAAEENTLEPGAVAAEENTLEPGATTLSPCVAAEKKGKSKDDAPPSWWMDEDEDTTGTESPSEPCAEIVEPAKNDKAKDGENAEPDAAWWGDEEAAADATTETAAEPSVFDDESDSEPADTTAAAPAADAAAPGGAAAGKKGEESDSPGWW